MAFEMCNFTDDEIVYIKNFNLKNYWNDHFTLNPSTGVVDRERKIYLVSMGYDSLVNLDDEAFVLVWNDFCVISVIKKNFTADDTALLSLLSIEIPKDIECYYKDIIHDLKNALIVYEAEGFSVLYNVYVSSSTIVKVDF